MSRAYLGAPSTPTEGHFAFWEWARRDESANIGVYPQSAQPWYPSAQPNMDVYLILLILQTHLSLGGFAGAYHPIHCTHAYSQDVSTLGEYRPASKKKPSHKACPSYTGQVGAQARRPV